MSDKLNILWTNNDPITAKLMVFMYAENAIKREWWSEVTVIVWGATAKLVATNDEVKQAIRGAQEAGVKISACLACADELGVTDNLKELNIELKYWGEPLTSIIKNGEKLITV